MTRQPATQSGRQRIEPGSVHVLDDERVQLEQLAQTLIGEYPEVLPRLGERVATVNGQWVAEARRHGADVGEGERLPTEHECRNVVPTREVLRGHNSRASTAEDSVNLPYESVGVGQMLDHLVRNDHVDAGVLERDRVVQTRDADVDSAGRRKLRALGDNFHADRALCPGRRRESEGELAVVTAEVQHRLGRRRGTERALDVLDVERRRRMEHRRGPSAEAASRRLWNGNRHAATVAAGGTSSGASRKLQCPQWRRRADKAPAAPAAISAHLRPTIAMVRTG